MKTIIPSRKFKALLIPAATAVLVILSADSFAGETPSRTAPFRDTILVNKTLSSKKHKIRLYPNADHEVLFFSAAGEPGKVYQLYLFDMDGKLTKQIQIRNRETTVLANIVKGSYVFEVFSDDERIENGHIEIK